MNSFGFHRLLAEGSWQQSFTHRTLQRGVARARENCVQSLAHTTLDPSTEALTGSVSDEKSKTYPCAVELRNNRGNLTVRAQCNCTEDNPCVHAAAMLMMAAHTVPDEWPGGAPPRGEGARRPSRKTAFAKIPEARRTADRYVDSTPEPVLSLRPFTPRAPPRQAIACARLQFDYGGFLLPPMNNEKQTVFTRKGRTIEVLRDAWSEQLAARRIATAGFINAAFFLLGHNIEEPRLKPHDLFIRPDKRRPPLAPGECAPLLAELQIDGFRIEYEDEFPRDELVEIENWHAELTRSANAWFDVSLGVEVEGKGVDLLPVLRHLLDDPDFSLSPQADENEDEKRRVRLDNTHSVEIPLKELRALIAPLIEWLRETEEDAGLRVHASQAPALQAFSQRSGLAWQGGEALRENLALLRNAPRSLDAPEGFRGTLRPYQREGLAWLHLLARAGLGGILADDMGLGKTVQVLAHILDEKRRGHIDKPVLIVAPTSLLGNWREEAARFTPELKLLVLHGGKRREQYAKIAEHDVAITTYPLLPRDRSYLLDDDFSLLVLDEAQAIKNSKSQAARIAGKIQAKRRLAMTGTPLENHLGELWAQFDAVEPGLLGNEKRFTKLYRSPIEKQGDTEKRDSLKRRIAPLLLRRRKDDVLADLPPKTTITRTLDLGREQRGLYESLRLSQHERVREAIQVRGLARSGIVVLDALLKLRQVCCDPRLVKLESARNVKSSTKLDALLELLASLLDEDRRILLFSQFTEMLGLIETSLRERDLPYLKLTGQTPGGERAELIERFQAGKAPIFLASLKAGGVGLNLTAADAVIHYDPWWNPAAENQATDRAHRIGQDKPVFVYKLICAGTVEEKIQGMQQRKADLARGILEGEGSGSLRFSENDLAELFAPL